MKSDHQKKDTIKPEPRVTVVNAVQDVEGTNKPFGKRWKQEEVTLNADHLVALQQGKYLAVDVQEEYVVFLKLDPAARSNP